MSDRRFEIRTGPWGFVLSAAVVLARAFCPGAVPVDEWSWWSWILMTAPALLPWYLFLACWAVSLAGIAVLKSVLVLLDGWEAAKRRLLP